MQSQQQNKILRSKTAEYFITRGIGCALILGACSEDESAVIITMAKQCLIEKCKRPPKFKVRKYYRCQRCGRRRGCYRKFQLCRICLRELALQGQIPGMVKASW